MIKLFMTLMRGRAEDGAEATRDRYALPLLRQQIRDAAGAIESALAAKNARQQDEMDALKAQVASLAAALAESKEPKEDKKLGRPRKEMAEA